jgi:uncharacterized RDD family membrane protein YckC
VTTVDEAVAPEPAPARTPGLTLDVDEPTDVDPVASLRPVLVSESPPAEPPRPAAPPAGSRDRLVAIWTDLLFVLAVDALVLYFTLKIARLGLDEVALVPALPFVGFLALLNAGYVTLLTAAGGQTLGKMAIGLKVVSTGDERIGLDRALLRTLAGCATLATLGLGLLPALFGHDRRALHDRIAGTRVIDTTDFDE